MRSRPTSGVRLHFCADSRGSRTIRTWTKLAGAGPRRLGTQRELDGVREARFLVAGAVGIAVPELHLDNRTRARVLERPGTDRAPVGVQVLDGFAVAQPVVPAGRHQPGARDGRDDALEARAVAPGNGLESAAAEVEEPVLGALDGARDHGEAPRRRGARRPAGAEQGLATGGGGPRGAVIRGGVH